MSAKLRFEALLNSRITLQEGYKCTGFEINSRLVSSYNFGNIFQIGNIGIKEATGNQ